MKTFDYVASGLSYMKLNSKELLNSPELLEWVNRGLSDLVSEKHDFSFLFNALTEKRHGDHLRDKFKFKNLYTDSGGLQMVTRGMTIDDKAKEDVYKVQSKTDYGLSFDEIPVVITSMTGKSKRNSGQTRKFDPSLLKECAVNTGKNVNKQIQIYKENNSKTKPIIILQGNDFETYKDWIRYLFEQIKIEDREYIECVASGAAAMGDGFIEDVQRLYFTKLVPEEYNIKHMHILGLGSVKRIIPLLLLRENIFPDWYISYDSTKHTAASTFGHYINEKGTITTIKREISDKYNHVFNDISSKYEMNMSIREFYDSINDNPSNYVKNNKDVNHVFKSHIGFCMGSMKNFINTVEKVDMLKTPDSIYPFLEDNTMIYMMLKNVKCDYTFNEWFIEAKSKLSSKKYSHVGDSSLEDLF